MKSKNQADGTVNECAVAIPWRHVQDKQKQAQSKYNIKIRDWSLKFKQEKLDIEYLHGCCEGIDARNRLMDYSKKKKKEQMMDLENICIQNVNQWNVGDVQSKTRK